MKWAEKKGLPEAFCALDQGENHAFQTEYL
jgi:hypothetical protein